MESEVTLVLRDVSYDVKGDCVGVEHGAYALIRNHHSLVCAIGDFDSISDSQYKLIEDNVSNIIKVSSIKDESDSELAVLWCIQNGYTRIHVYGALDERLDHQHINCLLAYKYPQVILYNDMNRIQAYEEGEHCIEREDFNYFSIFAYFPANISLIGFKYPLNHYDLRIDELKTVSNQWIKKDATLHVHQGKVLVYLTR